MGARLKHGALGSVAPVALVPAGAFAVHQLRYWLAFRSRAGVELQLQGHAYLHSVAPWLVLLIALGAGLFLKSLGRAIAGRRSLSGGTLSFGALWLVCAACLLAIYIFQESLEGLLVAGHPGGLVGIFGYGGWWSIPAALGVGLVLAATFHGARWVLDEVTERCSRFVGERRAAPSSARAPRALPIPRLIPLADGWSGRGPPS